MHKTTIRLADGRQLRYYDAAPGEPRDAADRRDLPPANSASQLRYEPFLDTWVIYASHRQDRSYLPSAQDCPLCPSADHPTEIPATDYEVVVFDNRFPALSSAPPGGSGRDTGTRGRRGGQRAGRARRPPAAARSSATPPITTLPSPGCRASGSSSCSGPSSTGLRSCPRCRGVDQVFCFENRGREIGVTKPHPHGQIYAYPFITPRTDKALSAARAYYRRTGRNLFDDVLAAEQADGTRIVTQTEHWIAFVPHAARWPYEIHLYPRRRVPDLASLGTAELTDLAGMELDIFGRFARLFDQPAPYIAGWHQAPVRSGGELFALHLELFTSRRASDKLKYLAGGVSHGRVRERRDARGRRRPAARGRR